MYFTPRGLDESVQRVMDCPTAQRFLEISISQKDISLFFKYHGIEKIAIAAASHFGQCLAKSLVNTQIKVVCFADKLYYKFENELCMGIPVIPYSKIMSESNPDIVVIASNYYFNDIADSLLDAGVLLENIFSINDILFGLDRLKV